MKEHHYQQQNNSQVTQLNRRTRNSARVQLIIHLRREHLPM